MLEYKSTRPATPELPPAHEKKPDDGSGNAEHQEADHRQRTQTTDYCSRSTCTTDRDAVIDHDLTNRSALLDGKRRDGLLSDPAIAPELGYDVRGKARDPFKVRDSVGFRAREMRSCSRARSLGAGDRQE